MKDLNIFDIIFTKKKSETYKEAMQSLTRVEDIISNTTMDFPDVSSKDIQTFKNKWIELEDSIGKGIHTMGLHKGKDYKSLLVHHQENSFSAQHFHSKEWEVITILDGSCYDKSTDIKLKKGDVYIIPRNAIHQIITKDTECYMYVMFSSNKQNLKISDSDKEIAKQLIGKKHSFKAK
tara:strand:+ start:1017 stop:1550 length:534 start_codon:yes stop_codon:yes gene_type:complete